MHEIDMLIDAIALSSFRGQTLSRLELLDEITQVKKVVCSESKLYQAIQRLKFRGLIEEVRSNGRSKPYRLTRKGSKAAQDIAKIFKESEA
jgi:DNA-binding PadR family transcriptional regulator